ncbi:hypothetical protein GWK47_007955 [Chionoecetes opilio]|uniref:Uncharacterized protein n=1 Tax=Chionoecetes opilio TaxID=41210 RepID=A0A8J4Y097_CHIOP|nr:hypothetical protein GWK47_007955 [Chionoecetes opilio]
MYPTKWAFSRWVVSKMASIRALSYRSQMSIMHFLTLETLTALSDQSKVTLRPVSLLSSGKYRCEVSADAPSFHTESRTAEMLVVGGDGSNNYLLRLNQGLQGGLESGVLVNQTNQASFDSIKSRCK